MAVLWIFLGIVLGASISLLRMPARLVGDLIIAHPDSDDPPNTLAQFYEPIDAFQHKKSVRMRIVHVNYKSHE